MSTSSTISSTCENLVNPALRFWNEDLDDIGRTPLSNLLEQFKEILRNWHVFKNQCFYSLPAEIYDYYDSVFAIALLKLAVVIEDKSAREAVLSEEIKNVISMFSEDEKNAIREFEKFKSLEPRVTPPRVLAEYIVSKRESIYSLVKDAVNKQYVNFDKLIESWSSAQKISNTVRRGLILKYRARFRNIVEAIKILLDQEVSWLRRLFSEYEDALLKSSTVRREFEDTFKKIIELSATMLEKRVKLLEEEKEVLLEEIRNLHAGIQELGVDKSNIEVKISELKERVNSLEASYKSVLEGVEKHLDELNSLKRLLLNNERELESLAEREKDNVVAREVLEAELSRVRQLVKNFNEKIEEFQRVKQLVEFEIAVAKERISEIEKNIKSIQEGIIVHADEAAVLEHLFVSKLRDKLLKSPLTLETPWGKETVKKWNERVFYENAETTAVMPRNTRLVLTYEKRGLLGLTETKRIEIRGIFVSDLDSFRKRGYQSRRASLGDLAKVLQEVQTADSRTFILIGIASPTGWDERAVKYVSGEAPALITKNAIVFLVDLLRNKVYYPEHLAKTYPHIENYARIFTLETDIEEEARVEKTIRELCVEAIARSPWEPVFPYRRVYEKLGRTASTLSILRVVDRLADKGVIEIVKGEREYLVSCKKVD